jgi:hypothetical protein
VTLEIVTINWWRYGDSNPEYKLARLAYSQLYYTPEFGGSRG